MARVPRAPAVTDKISLPWPLAQNHPPPPPPTDGAPPAVQEDTAALYVGSLTLAGRRLACRRRRFASSPPRSAEPPMLVPDVFFQFSQRQLPTVGCFSTPHSSDNSPVFPRVVTSQVIAAIKGRPSSLLDVYDHTTLKAPVLVRSPKLSSVGPAQYLDG